jgi:hypothetical protein
MIVHEMAAAFLAVLPLTEFGLLEHGNMFRTSGNPHRIRLPKGESSDWGSQDLHDWQWQYPIASGSPETST